MKKNVVFIFLLILFLPVFAKADTWLDENVSRDISWFDEDTYSTTSTYKLTGYTGSKLAGLLYLVNVKGYTFSGKTIQLEVEESTRSCKNANSLTGYCILLADSHYWVPLASHFDGIFDLRKNGNGAGMGYQSIDVKSLDSTISFTESGSCKYMTDSGVVTNTCSFAKFARYYSINKEPTNKGTFSVKDVGLAKSSVEVKLSPNDGYSSSVSILDSDGNRAASCTVSGNSCVFSMPSKPVTIKVTFTKKRNVYVNNFEQTKQCVVISGTGNNLGDELRCGTEYFYVLENDGEEIKMLSKYNLYTGVTIYKDKIEKQDGDSRTDEQYCRDLAESKGGYVKNDSFYNAPGYCFYYIDIKTDKVKQSENAISAQWDENEKYIYPQVGDLYPIASTTYPYDFSSSTYNKSLYDNLFFDYYLSISTDGASISAALSNYFSFLGEEGYGPLDIDLLSLNDINKIVAKNNNSIPYQEWYDNSILVDPNSTNVHNEFGRLNGLLPDEYNWIYGTTYWLKSGYGRIMNSDNFGVLFVDTSGGVCGANMTVIHSNGCDVVAKTSIGAGARPVVTIPNKLRYLISTETDGHGTIDVIETASGGEEISFKVDSEQDYKLDSLTIITDSGEKVEFVLGEFKENEDGTITINTSKFTMPFENVTIIANFMKEEIDPVPQNQEEIKEEKPEEKPEEEPKEEQKQQEPNKEETTIEEAEDNPNTGNSIISLCFVISLFSILAMCYYIPTLKKE